MAMFDMDELFSTIEQTAMKLVLVVEADAEIGPLLVQAIKEETPYQAFLVTNGVQALQISREVTPNLFLLDYRLPGMDGFELYKLLHTMEELEYVPAILMSASSFFSRRDNEQHKIPNLQKALELDCLLHIIRELLA
jgi:CheY-like chemotaxis protein